MNQFKKRYQNKVMQKKREEAAELKKRDEAGENDWMIDSIRKARKPSIKPEDLPY